MPGKKKLPDCSVLKRFYIDKGMSMQDIGDVYDVSRVAVKKAIDKCGIRARSFSEARLLAMDKGKVDVTDKFNKHFFDEINESSAWALGVLFACASEEHGLGRISIIISPEKMWVMKSLMEMMEFNEFKWNPNDWDTGYNLIFTSVEMVNRLKELGFPGRKREDFTMPNLIYPDHWEPFLLGYYQRRGWTSYSKKFLEEVAYLLVEMRLVDRAEIVGIREYRIITKGEKRWMKKNTTE
jgi:predicted DNA-binding protein YlxM (UPF0122 family)